VTVAFLRRRPAPLTRPGEVPRLIINGRFLGQPQSGVQRFAYEMARELSDIWPQASELPVALCPPGTPAVSAPFRVKNVGRRSGVPWEQADLPRAVAGGLLVNLANTAPLLVRRQAVVIHDMGTFDVPEAYSWAFRAYYGIVLRVLARAGIRIVTVSEFSRSAVARHLGVPEGEIAVVGEGADHMRRLIADPGTLSRHGLTQGGYVLAVGNLSRHKNLAILGEAAGALNMRGTPLVIAGQINRIFDSGGVRLPEPARYLGRVSDAELKALYQGAACFIFPSLYEGFGLPAVEAMASGCPVLSSSAPGLRETCGDAALYFDPASPGDVAATVCRFLDDPFMADRLRRAGTARAGGFTWSRAARLLKAALLPEAPSGSGGAVRPAYAPLEAHDASSSDTVFSHTSRGGTGLMRIAVGIPTVGRASILAETLRELGRQSRVPDRVLVCGAQESDAANAAEAYPGVEVLLERQPSLTGQRNRIMLAASDVEGTPAPVQVVIFFDDDFLPDSGYLAEIERAMSTDPFIVVATGNVILDGIGGPGLTPGEGRAALSRLREPAGRAVHPIFTGYGCNMAVRLDPVLRHRVLFDERLPLYAWQEDVDFSRRLGAYGSIVKLESAFGVHLGVKSGRGSGVRLGYSQVANPLYISRKRLGYPLRRALAHTARNMAMNVVKFVRPEPYVDRRGRLRGNILALRDLLVGRMRPDRVLKL
jgi:glycosyltransferase involved in cell wall biosynthesis/GT2 family glycosyltransferase